MVHFESNDFMQLIGPFMAYLVIGIAVLTLILHIIFAVAVFIDADAYLAKHRRPVLVGPIVWALATLLGGVFVAAIYWAMHRSTLRPEAQPAHISAA